MRLTLENVIIILSLILTEAWFLNSYLSGSPDFEPAIAFIFALGALFTKDRIKEHFGYFDYAAQHDLKLFNEFQHVFPAEPTLRLLKTTDFGNSFRGTDIQPLYNFVETWDSVEKEFLNNKLEKEKKDLYKEADDLAIEFCKRTVPIGNGDYFSVFPDKLRNSQRPEFVIEDAKVLNEKARLFTPKYESFIRKCRTILEK